MRFVFKIAFMIINAIVISTMALLLSACCINRRVILNSNKLIIIDENTNRKIEEYDIDNSSFFSISFIHSVNMSKVTDYYKFDNDNNIYVYKTIYYNYGAGVETELENNEILSYGEDGSMIIDNINKRIDSLVYYLSDIFDHKLRINDGEEISLWEVCGKNKTIQIIKR